MNKEQIRQFGYELGADAVGAAAIEDYDSKKMPPPRAILSALRSVIVLGHRELDGTVESENAWVSMTSRMGGMELALKNNYLMVRYEVEYT